jgi:Na+-translocating ferredoxin:NAD+ oxidoreductase RnfD subunit
MHPMVAITAALTGIFTLAIIATVFSKNAQTPQVLQMAGTALSGVIAAATAPVSGNATNLGSQVANSLGSTLTSAGAQQLGTFG